MRDSGRLVCNDHRCMPDDFVADLVSLLINLRNHVYGCVFVVNMGYGVVQFRVERLPCGAHLGHAQLFQRFFQLRLDHFHALAQVFDTALLLLQRALQIVCHRQELEHCGRWR